MKVSEFDDIGDSIVLQFHSEGIRTAEDIVKTDIYRLAELTNDLSIALYLRGQAVDHLGYEKLENMETKDVEFTDEHLSDKEISDESIYDYEPNS